ncbi:OmpA family protein [bacterium]|nr:OmpA family protein [bacterium]
MDDDAPPGVPEWVVTYGDMMSLLLTFFIMLVSLSEVKANKKYRAVLESLQKGVGYRAGPLAPPGDYFPLNSMVDGNSTLGSFKKAGVGKGGVKAQQTPDGDDQRVYIPRHGEPVPAGDYILYREHQIEPDAAALSQIDTISLNLAGKPNKIEICGHTSSKPLPSDSSYRNLMELSYARARCVYNRMLADGVEPHRLRIVAYADHAPLPTSHDAQELNQDRVNVLILDTYHNDYIGPRE